MESHANVAHCETKGIKHYRSSHKILLVGEGNFSFAVCLAKAFGSGCNMVATSLDSESDLMVKHPSASDNLKILRELGCTILHQVDAKTMSQDNRLRWKLYDRIVFNFPHAGFVFKEHSIDQITLHQRVVKGFFRNARKMLSVDGEVHVTHKTAYPFSEWQIVNLAKKVVLDLVDEVWFYIFEYRGYENKRGDGRRSDESFPVGQCSTFKFADAL